MSPLQVLEWKKKNCKVKNQEFELEEERERTNGNKKKKTEREEKIIQVLPQISFKFMR